MMSATSPSLPSIPRALARSLRAPRSPLLASLLLTPARDMRVRCGQVVVLVQ